MWFKPNYLVNFETYDLDINSLYVIYDIIGYNDIKNILLSKVVTIKDFNNIRCNDRKYYLETYKQYLWLKINAYILGYKIRFSNSYNNVPRDYLSQSDFTSRIESDNNAVECYYNYI